MNSTLSIRRFVSNVCLLFILSSIFVLGLVNRANAATDYPSDFNLSISPIICVLENLETGTSEIQNVVPDLCESLPVLCELETVDIGLAPPNTIIFRHCKDVIPTNAAENSTNQANVSNILLNSNESNEVVNRTIHQEREDIARRLATQRQAEIIRVEKAIATVVTTIIGIYVVDVLVLDLFITQRSWFILSRVFGRLL